MSDKSYITDPEEWLQDITKHHEYVCIVIFRGSWCKQDQYYLTKLGEMQLEAMKKEGVYLIAWTSEGEEEARRADLGWGLTSILGYDMVIGDRSCALAEWLKEDQLLPKLIKNEQNGDIQPAIVFFAHHGNFVFHWEAASATIKSSTNFNGVTAPPIPSGKFFIVIHLQTLIKH